MEAKPNNIAGETFKLLRSKTGFTQVELARKLEINQSLVAKFESGSRKLPRFDPSSKFYSVLEEVFGQEDVASLANLAGVIIPRVAVVDRGIMIAIYASPETLTEQENQILKLEIDRLLKDLFLARSHRALRADRLNALPNSSFEAQT